MLYSALYNTTNRQIKLGFSPGHSPVTKHQCCNRASQLVCVHGLDVLAGEIRSVRIYRSRYTGELYMRSIVILHDDGSGKSI